MKLIMATSTDEFIAAERAVLDRLERFVRTDQYGRLKAVLLEAHANLPDAWLAKWLISPAFGLDTLPIDLADERDGIELLETHLMRIAGASGA